MATNFTVSVDEVSCPVCCDVFTNPVLLLCSHSVCKACLQQCWRDGTRKCPLCRRVAPPGANPPVNLALKNLCERFALEQEAGGGSETLCSLHQEKLLLFCLVDKQPICADCVSNLHNNHKLCHIKVAAQDHQMKVQEALKPLQEKLKNFHGIKDTVNQSMQHIKHQVQHTERQIKKEFKELHQFLYHEEAARIAALKQEEMQKSAALNRKMEETLRKIEALSATISTIEKDMGKEDALFLQNFNATMKRAQCTIREPDASGLLIDVAKHVGNLKYTVWEKMLGVVQYTPVILDPNTACPLLRLSADLTTVQGSKKEQLLPDNPERFSGIYCVLGSKGFNSGKYQWDVKVSCTFYGEIGVAKMSVDRKETHGYLPSDKFCTLTLIGVCESKKITSRGGKYNIRVHLDCDHRTVSFFDLYGNKGIKTSTYTFTGMVFPLLCFMHEQMVTRQTEVLHIMPARVKIKA